MLSTNQSCKSPISHAVNGSTGSPTTAGRCHHQQSADVLTPPMPCPLQSGRWEHPLPPSLEQMLQATQFRHDSSTSRSPLARRRARSSRPTTAVASLRRLLQTQKPPLMVRQAHHERLFKADRHTSWAHSERNK